MAPAVLLAPIFWGLRRGKQNSFSSPGLLQESLACVPQVVDMPLLFETKSTWLFSDIIVVTCDPEQQLQRLRLRDGSAEEDAAQRITAQMPQAYKAAHATILIDNSGSIATTRQQVRLRLFEFETTPLWIRS